MWHQKNEDFLILLSFVLNGEEIILISYDWNIKMGMCYISNVVDPSARKMRLLRESEIDILKFKSILLAIELGWKINPKYLSDF